MLFYYYYYFYFYYNYSPNTVFLKGIAKDYKTYSDRLNNCRLDLNSEKSKLAKCGDPYKCDKYTGIFFFFFFKGK